MTEKEVTVSVVSKMFCVCVCERYGDILCYFMYVFVHFMNSN